VKGTRSRSSIFAIALAVGIVMLGETEPEAPAADTSARRAELREARRVLFEIKDRRDETWRWERLMGGRLTPHGATAGRATSIEYRRWVLKQWRQRARRARTEAHSPPHADGWRCIHAFEGAWNDPDAPYFGGLQMDLTFQRTYGGDLLRRKGTADKWTPLEQMWVAERAYRYRGFRPWPNTARLCHLL
jgi:hypothetical protein